MSKLLEKARAFLNFLGDHRPMIEGAYVFEELRREVVELEDADLQREELSAALAAFDAAKGGAK